jgi:formylmethanofuran dehydrogenase subunit E
MKDFSDWHPRDRMKAKQEQNTTKTTKRERRKKLSKFKDVAHKCFGNVSVTGIGEGKPIICDGCKERVYKAKAVVLKGYLITYCERCNPEEILDKKLGYDKPSEG